ncbi:hypothetical protein OHV05_35340 (plasmid) [Kitasatospora sp. NBC_00070]|uniref:hypothetical protein n=1 Tax=Kitasatospora sp. NBC_00070 TaxID=2975962 RepID=UPI00325065C0
MKSPPDMWNAADCGLIDEKAAELLSAVGTPAADRRRAPAPLGTRMVDTPRYQPYRSCSMPLHENGYQTARSILAAVYSDEVRQAVLAGAMADTVRRTVAVQATGLWRNGATPAAAGLAALARIAPRKGGEVKQLWAEYRRRNAQATDPIMAMRELWGSIYTWQFIRGEDARLHDLCASLLCLTTAVDFAGARDDSGAGGHHPYMVAASEGLTCLAGTAVNQTIQDIVAVGGLMTVKDALTEAVPDAASGPPGTSVTPHEFLRARWWDGAMAPHHRVMLATDHYRHVSDDHGVFTTTRSCPAIARSVDNLLRYNDIVDAVSDYVHRECFNTLLLALVCGGCRSVEGYGAALSEACDAALACECGQTGHQEAAELSMGACLWYLLVPRYLVGRQLDVLGRPGSQVAASYALPPPGRRLRSTGCTLTPGAELHTAAWEPLWRAGTVRSVDDNAQRVLRRCLPDATGSTHCSTEAHSALARCEGAESIHDLARLAENWQRLYDAVLSESGAPRSGSAAALRPLIGRIWRQAVLGRTPAGGTAAGLFIDVDQAVRETYRLTAEEGLRVRRAFFGVCTGMVELAGVNPYNRMVAGIVSTCR